MKSDKHKYVKVNLNHLNLKVVKSPKTNETFLMKAAWFIGSTAGIIHEIIIKTWFRVIFAIAALYLLMHWVGISIEIHRAGGLLLRIK